MPRDAYLESRVLAADPVELIHILYEHGLTQVRTALAALAAGDIPGRCQAVTKVLAALGELEGSLNHDSGGAISHNFARLYQYMRRRLTAGNLKQDDAALAEVESLMQTLDEGWAAMQHKISYPAVPPEYQTVGGNAHGWSA